LIVSESDSDCFLTPTIHDRVFPLRHLTLDNFLDPREQAARWAVLLVAFFPGSHIFSLILRRRGEFVQLDVYDFVARQVTQDRLPRNPGNSHELIRARHEQFDPIAIDIAQFGPKLLHDIDRLLQN
jgi:hypothetical protein